MLFADPLFVIHANLIRDQIRDDLESGAKVPYPREWLSRVHGALDTEIAKSSAAGPHYYSTLGFNPDYLMWNQTSIVRQLYQEFDDNLSGLCAFYRFYYWRVWLQRPLLVVKKIAGQLAIFYTPKCPAYRLRKSVSLTDEYQRSVTLLEPFRELWTAYSPAVAFRNRAALLARSAPVIEQPVYVRRTHEILAAMYLVLLLIALALSAFVFMQKERRRRFGWFAALILFAYAYSFANCLEVAIVHSLANPRYTTVQMFVTILSQFLTVTLIVEIVLESRVLIACKRKMLVADVIAKTSMNLGGALFALVFPACPLFGVDLPKPDIVVAADGTGDFKTIQSGGRIHSRHKPRTCHRADQKRHIP